MTEVSVTAEAIRAAVDRVPAAFRDMPQFVSEPLSEALGRPSWSRPRSANPIGCFKGRGTWLAVEALAAAGEVGEGSGLVAASAGNFGQGVAYAARAHRVPFVVFAAENANAAKVAAMRRLGAEVRLVGEDFDAAREAAADHAAAIGMAADRRRAGSAHRHRRRHHGRRADRCGRGAATCRRWTRSTCRSATAR